MDFFLFLALPGASRTAISGSRRTKTDSCHKLCRFTLFEGFVFASIYISAQQKKKDMRAPNCLIHSSAGREARPV